MEYSTISFEPFPQAPLTSFLIGGTIQLEKVVTDNWKKCEIMVKNLLLGSGKGSSHRFLGAPNNFRSINLWEKFILFIQVGLLGDMKRDYWIIGWSLFGKFIQKYFYRQYPVILLSLLYNKILISIFGKFSPYWLGCIINTFSAGHKRTGCLVTW